MTAENHTLMYDGTATHTADATVGAAAGTILAANANRRSAVIQNVHASVSIRVTIDGQTPTSSLGFLLAAGQSLSLESPGCSKAAIKEIRVGGSDGTVGVTEVV